MGQTSSSALFALGMGSAVRGDTTLCLKSKAHAKWRKKPAASSPRDCVFRAATARSWGSDASLGSWKASWTTRDASKGCATTGGGAAAGSRGRGQHRSRRWSDGSSGGWGTVWR